MPCYLGLERFKSSECLESALAALCRQISRPAAMFDKFEVIDLLNSLARGLLEVKGTKRLKSKRLGKTRLKQEWILWMPHSYSAFFSGC